MTGTDTRSLWATLSRPRCCCAAAAPVLLVAGTLGGILANSWLLATAGALLLVALIVTVLRVRGHSCSTGNSPHAGDNY